MAFAQMNARARIRFADSTGDARPAVSRRTLAAPARHGFQVTLTEFVRLNVAFVQYVLKSRKSTW
jgi:hypothetical protein